MAYAQRHPVVPPKQPVLIVALEGWIDAGFAAATALTAVLSDSMTETFASFNGDDLIDQRARRPRLRIESGVRQGISWPEPSFLVGYDGTGEALAILLGPEPDFRWRPFTTEVVDMARELECRLAVGLGAFPIAAPHTRPIQLTATASDASLLNRFRITQGTLDVPAGIGEVIGNACAQAGIPSLALWARVPHYVAAMPFAPAALALVEALSGVSGLTFATDALAASAAEARRQVDDLIAQSEEHKTMVRHLEQQFDLGGDRIAEFGGDLPTGDEIASELERYLRGETT